MISVIIPVCKEAKALPRTLEHLFQQEGEYEVLVLDGGSTDALTVVLTGCPWVRVLAALKGRASQMNRGAVSA